MQHFPEAANDRVSRRIGWFVSSHRLQFIEIVDNTSSNQLFQVIRRKHLIAAKNKQDILEVKAFFSASLSLVKYLENNSVANLHHSLSDSIQFSPDASA